MAGTCNDCGAPTWGRYRICPECRYARKHGRRRQKYSSTDAFFIGIGTLVLFSWVAWTIIEKEGSIFSGIHFILLGIFAFVALWKISLNKQKEANKEEESEINKKIKKILNVTLLIIICLSILYFFIASNLNKAPDSENSNQELSTLPPESSSQETISLEEELTNFCISKFSNAGIFDLEKTDYQKDFSSASDWIRNNYENSALTQEQKENNVNKIIEDELPETGYPLVITYGSKKVTEQAVSHGFYYCNKNGVI